MAGSVNKVILVGNVGKDPEIRRSADGKPIANFSIATSETWKDRNSGERKERTEWHRIVIFNENLCKIVENYVKKGSKLYIEGALQTRKWTDKDGSEKYSTEIVLQNYNGTLTLLDSAGGGARSGDSGGYEDDSIGGYLNAPNNASASSSGFTPKASSKTQMSEMLNDDIPF